MDAREMFRDLVRQLDQDQAIGAALWSYLPSYEGAQHSHGDYADEYMPSISDVMSEACELLASQRYDHVETPPTVCPCEECRIAAGLME